MGRRRTFDLEEVLDTAIQTFWERGFEATSIDDLTQQTGLSRSSLYAAFGNKDEFFTDVLARYLERYPAANLEELEDGAEGLASIRRFFGALVEGAEQGATVLGCLAANTIAELGVRGTNQRRLLDDYRARLNAAFASALGRAAEDGEIAPVDQQLRARALGTIALGLFLTLRGNPDAVREARETADAVEAIIRSWTPVPSLAPGT